MADQASVNQAEQQQTSDKEFNFRALEQKYQRALDQERQAREHAEAQVREANNRKAAVEEEEDDNEPYIDKKKLIKTMNSFGQSTQSDIQKAMERAKNSAKEELKQEMWLENNPDFYDVLQHAEKFANRAPKLAETILRMPEGFDRQKLVYQNIKELGIDKPKATDSSIQQKVDANRRGPYYQPTGMGTSPYAGQQADFSQAGQKSAHDKMQELKNRLRMG